METKKLFLVFVLFLLRSGSIFSQTHEELIAALQASKADSLRINIQLGLASHFLYKPKEEEVDLATCERYLDDAEQLSRKLKLPNFLHYTLKLRGALAVERKQYEKAHSIFVAVANYFYKISPKYAAVTWEYYGDQFSIDDLTHSGLKDSTYIKAYGNFLEGKAFIRAAEMLVKRSEIALNNKDFNKAETLLKSALTRYDSLKYAKKYKVYSGLSELYYRKDEMQKRLLMLIELVNSYEADPGKDENAGLDYYFMLSGAYFNDKNFNQALIYYKKLTDQSIKLNSTTYYYLAIHGVVRCYSNLKQYQQAMSFLKKAERQFKDKTIQQQAILISSSLKLYLLMERTKEAKAMIGRFRSIFEQYRQEAIQDQSYYAIDNYLVFYDPLPSYYLQIADWQMLSAELQKMKMLPSRHRSALTKIKLLRYEYKVDSAQGRLFQALNNFQTLTAMRDSMTTSSNTKQINELEARYLSVKKDRTIEQLNSQAIIQKSKIAQINMQRNATLAGTILAVVVSASLYIAYRTKKRSNLRLEEKQEKINSQNLALSQVIREKEKLIDEKDTLFIQQENLVAEKEWLIKEIHHRVKNNLQIIMSLLYTQSAYLQNTDAVEAIRDVQNRVQAISIIHQKLYMKTGVANVLMSDYLNEMISFLAHSYNASLRKINFRQRISPVKIDIAQAVPMGLIVNEAITNAIKYAFGENGGSVSITSQALEDDQIILSISDNGIGLPLNFKLANTSSLGMEMMKALTKQLGGTFDIINNNGVEIRIHFSLQKNSTQHPGSYISS